MAVFKYKTYDSAGKRVTGVIDADNPRQATSKLKKRGLYPFELSVEAAAGEKREKKSRRRASPHAPPGRAFPTRSSRAS